MLLIFGVNVPSTDWNSQTNNVYKNLLFGDAKLIKKGRHHLFFGGFFVGKPFARPPDYGEFAAFSLPHQIHYQRACRLPLTRLPDRAPPPSPLVTPHHPRNPLQSLHSPPYCPLYSYSNSIPISQNLRSKPNTHPHPHSKPTFREEIFRSFFYIWIFLINFSLNNPLQFLLTT